MHPSATVARAAHTRQPAEVRPMTHPIVDRAVIPEIGLSPAECFERFLDTHAASRVPVGMGALARLFDEGPGFVLGADDAGEIWCVVGDGRLGARVGATTSA